MLNGLHGFAAGEAGQDIVEYDLLLAFVVLVAAGIFSLTNVNIASIWTSANTSLKSGVQAVS
jgi:Flp pilus assembly pilin Flp